MFFSSRKKPADLSDRLQVARSDAVGRCFRHRRRSENDRDQPSVAAGLQSVAARQADLWSGLFRDDSRRRQVDLLPMTFTHPTRSSNPRVGVDASFSSHLRPKRRAAASKRPPGGRQNVGKSSPNRRKIGANGQQNTTRPAFQTVCKPGTDVRHKSGIIRTVGGARRRVVKRSELGRRLRSGGDGGKIIPAWASESPTRFRRPSGWKFPVDGKSRAEYRRRFSNPTLTPFGTTGVGRSGSNTRANVKAVPSPSVV